MEPLWIDRKLGGRFRAVPGGVLERDERIVEDAVLGAALNLAQALAFLRGAKAATKTRPTTFEASLAAGERPDFGRFPLPSSQRFGAEVVVELRHAFMVEAQHVPQPSVLGWIKPNEPAGDFRVDGARFRPVADGC